MADEPIVTDGSAELQLDSQDLLTALEQESAGSEEAGGSAEVDQNADAAAAGAKDITGQEKDTSTPAGEKEGQEKESESPADENEDGKEKPPPYDQDPKWKAARAAEKALNDLLAETDHESVQDLIDDLKSGKSLQETLGDVDLETVLKKAQTLEKYEKIWAEQERQKQREEETPEETIERLEQEKQDLVESQKQEEESQDAQAEAQANLDEYTAEITKAVEGTEDLSEEKQNLAKLLLGLDNPATTVDITDKTAVREMIGTQIEKVTELFGKIEQAAIDRYADGKAEVSRRGKPPVSESAMTTEKTFKIGDDEVVNDANVGDYFSQGAKELHELLQGLISEQP